jgi:hypothetical protein
VALHHRPAGKGAQRAAPYLHPAFSLTGEVNGYVRRVSRPRHDTNTTDVAGGGTEVSRHRPRMSDGTHTAR